MSRLPLVSERTMRNGCPRYPKDKLRQRNENTYSLQDKARALVITALCGSRQASRWLPIPQQTLSDWHRGKHVSDEVYEMAKHFAEELASKLESIADLIAFDMPNKIGAAGLKDEAIALGIVVDKRQLLQGLPTAITEAQNFTNEERAKRLNEILDRAKSRENNTDE